MSAGGLSKERLNRLHEVMARYVERGDVPGMVTLLCRRGEVQVNATGTLKKGSREPIARDTIFRLLSMSKPITAAAALILVEDCRLRLDDGVDQWLPELANRRVLKRLDGPLDDTVPAKRPITVRDLLTYRMGFGHIWAPPDAYPILKSANELQIGMGPNVSATPSPDECIRRLGTLPLMHQPGERWMYHTSSDVLGVLIARVSGQSLQTFLRERLFEPLGMKDTDFSVPASKVKRLATGYWTEIDWLATTYSSDWCGPVTGELQIFDEATDGQWSRPPQFPSGSAGLVSTIDDYLAFGQMMLNKGRHGRTRVLSRPSVETMTTDHLTSGQKAVSGFFEGYFDNRGWGFGLSVVTRRDHTALPVGTFGWNGGLGTSWYSDPSEEMVGILMTQRAWTSPHPPAFCRDFWTLAYQAIDD
jgi:CubicO group peptidase (beta-lactamase class C family)